VKRHAAASVWPCDRRQFILSGAHKTDLVIGANVFTRILKWKTGRHCVLFAQVRGQLSYDDSRTGRRCCRLDGQDGRAPKACTCRLGRTAETDVAANSHRTGTISVRRWPRGVPLASR